MLFELIDYFTQKPFLINGISPHDLDKLFQENFKETTQLTLEDQKQVCLLIDLLRHLVLAKKIEIVAQEFVFFGSQCPTTNVELFKSILEKNVAQEKGLLKFIFNKVNSMSESLAILNCFDKNVIQGYFEKY